MRYTFYKYQGAGNDFVIIDNREKTFHSDTVAIRSICDRRFGIGADGLMTLSLDSSHDFSMRYYNSDGRESTMCGNGGRCIVAFAYKLGLVHEKTQFSAIDGLHEALLISPSYVRLKMQDVKGIRKYKEDFIVDTGSPHYVHFVPEVAPLNMVEEGKRIRYSSDFEKAGINVNYVEPAGPGSIKMRTYERGVEDETLACGTGSVASAIITAYILQPDINSFQIHAPGGDLKVSFLKTGAEQFMDIWLEGPATFVFEGQIEI